MTCAPALFRPSPRPTSSSHARRRWRDRARCRRPAQTIGCRAFQSASRGRVVDFIEEVEEKLRSERYLALARVWLPWFLAALACAVIGWLGVWAYRSWEDRNVGAASVAYDRGLQALSSGDQTGAYEAFGAAARTAPSGYKSLSLMQQGNIRLAAGKDADAA